MVTTAIAERIEEIPVPHLGIWERYRVTIKSKTPLLMNRVTAEAVAGMQQTVRGGRGRKRLTPKQKAVMSRYLTPNGNLSIPRPNVLAMIYEAAQLFKIGKASLRPSILSAIEMEEEYIDLGTKKYEIDDRTVVIQRARIPGGRARIDEWGGSFHLLIDSEVVGGTVDVSNNGKRENFSAVSALLEQAFSRVGMCDYRPAHKGTCGLSHVVKLEKLEI